MTGRGEIMTERSATGRDNDGTKRDGRDNDGTKRDGER